MVSGWKVTVLCGLEGFEGVGGRRRGLLSVEAEAIMEAEGFLEQLRTANSRFREVLRSYHVHENVECGHDEEIRIPRGSELGACQATFLQNYFPTVKLQSTWP